MMNSVYNRILKIVDPKNFRFVVILYEDSNQIKEIKKLLQKEYSSYKHYDFDISKILSQKNGFMYINDFDELLSDHDSSVVINQKRDKIAKSSLNILTFYPKKLEANLHRKATKMIPDFWEFRAPIISLESQHLKPSIVDNQIFIVDSIRTQDSNSYSSLGGLTTQSKQKEIERLYKKLQKSKSKELRVNLISQLAKLYYEVGEYKNAKIFEEKALKIYKELLGEKDPSVGASYNNLAGLYQMFGEYDKALSFYEKALEITKEVLGEDHSDTATIYNNIASTYEALGKHHKALSLHKKALKIREDSLEQNHPNIGQTHNNIAQVYVSLGEYDKALSFYEKALEITKEVLGENHPDTATIYNNIAGIYQSLGDYDKALPLYVKAFEISKETLGEKHPDTAISYNNLAIIFELLGDYAKALSFYEKALDIDKKTLGKNHLQTAIAYSNLAHLYFKMQDFKKAESYMQKSIKIRERILPDNHPELISLKKGLEIIRKKLLPQASS